MNIENKNIQVATGSPRTISVHVVDAAGAPVTSGVAVELMLTAPLTGAPRIIPAVPQDGTYTITVPADLAPVTNPATGELIPWHYALRAGASAAVARGSFLSGELHLLPAVLAGDLTSPISLAATYDPASASVSSAAFASPTPGGVSEEDLVEYGLLETVTFTESEEVLAAARPAGPFADCCGFSLAAADADLYFDSITVHYLGASEEHTLKITKCNGPKVYTSVRTVVGDNCAQFFFEKKLNFRFVVSMTIEGGRPFRSYDASVQLSPGLASAAWLEPAGDYSGLFPRFSLSCDKAKQSYKPSSARQYVTIQVRGVKKVDESFYGELEFWRYSTSATGWRIIDPQGPLADWQVDCGANCEPGWLFRELWERPSATGETDVALVGWEFVLLAGEEEILLRNVRDMASVLSDASGGVNTLHYKVIYHD